MPEIRLKEIGLGMRIFVQGASILGPCWRVFLAVLFSISSVILSGLFDTLWGSSVGAVCGVWVQK